MCMHGRPFIHPMQSYYLKAKAIRVTFETTSRFGKVVLITLMFLLSHKLKVWLDLLLRDNWNFWWKGLTWLGMQASKRWCAAAQGQQHSSQRRENSSGREEESVTLHPSSDRERGAPPTPTQPFNSGTKWLYAVIYHHTICLNNASSWEEKVTYFFFG